MPARRGSRITPKTAVFGVMLAPFPPNSPTKAIGRRLRAVRLSLFSLLVNLLLPMRPCTALCVPYPKGRHFSAFGSKFSGLWAKASSFARL